MHERSLHIIFPEGTFGVLPNIVRRLGPWRVLIGGDIIALKPHYRDQLAEQGFALVYQESALFCPGLAVSMAPCAPIPATRK